LAGTLRPEKKTYSRLAGYVFQRVQITTGKNYDWKKKGTVELSDRLFFPAGSNNIQKNYDWKKKVQSSGRWRRLRFGGNVTIGKKTYSCLAGYVFQRVQITTGKNYDRKKKVQSSGQPFFPIIIFSGRNLIYEETRQKT
jgi:hypothetical protein